MKKLKINQELQEVIDSHNNILIFSGAGVSTDSGISDYKHSEYFFSKILNQNILVRTILTKETYRRNKQLFFEYYFYLRELLSTKSSNTSHEFPLFLEDKLLGVITQNIDGLYSLDKDRLCEIHGNVNTLICLKCKRNCKYTVSKHGVPHSECCHFECKPNIVLYGENFPNDELNKYNEFFNKTDCIIVMGTELDIIPHKEKIANSKAYKVLLNKNDVKLTRSIPTIYGGTRIESIDWDLKIIDKLGNIFESTY